MLTPESLPADPDAIEMPLHGHETAHSDEVPTFSMPVERTDGPDAQEASDVDQLYTDLRSGPLPEAADILTHNFSEGVEDQAMPELHDRASELPRISPHGHFDWNSPPAFTSGRLATGAGHLKTLSDIASSQSRASDSTNGRAAEEPEVLVISDDEDELDEVSGPLPLGTSDLDIPADAGYDDQDDEDGDEDGDDDNGNDSVNEDEREGSVGLEEGAEEDAIQGLPEEFGPEIVDMLKNGQLNTDGEH